jgi:hypothetical protein
MLFGDGLSLQLVESFLLLLVSDDELTHVRVISESNTLLILLLLLHVHFTNSHRLLLLFLYQKASQFWVDNLLRAIGSSKIIDRQGLFLPTL